jgi:predicted ATP-grasp superfamily ATP-dependent carboligase
MLFGLIRRYNIGEIPLIIQQWVDGGDSEVHFVLAYISRDHEPLGVCMGRKLRQYPPLTGSTSVAETISIPEIEEAALRLLLKAKCVGFCSVEFKKSKRDGEFYITEPTIGRPDTQEGICIAADSDFSLIAYLDAIGGKVEKKGKFRSGIRWINEPLEFYCLQQLWGGGSSIREFFSIYGGKRSYSVWAGDDLRPVVAFVKEKIAKGFRRLC